MFITDTCSPEQLVRYNVLSMQQPQMTIRAWEIAEQYAAICDGHEFTGKRKKTKLYSSIKATVINRKATVVFLRFRLKG